MHANHPTGITENFPILIADDSAHDRFVLRRAFERLNHFKSITETGSGEDTIAYLEGAGRYADRETYPYPVLLLLDLKMPGTSGFEILDWLRFQEHRPFKIMAFTSSINPADERKSLELGADFFHVKPAMFQETVDLARRLEIFLSTYEVCDPLM